MDKSIREFRRAIETGGLRLIGLSRTSKQHYRATIESPTGRKMTYILASSNSDTRAVKNRLADVKRFFNN